VPPVPFSPSVSWRSKVALHLGEALEAQGDLSGAIAAYELSLSLHPDYAQGLFRLASALLTAHGADEEATLKQLTVAKSANPEGELAMLHAGMFILHFWITLSLFVIYYRPVFVCRLGVSMFSISHLWI